jgi:hypothetical protein
MDYIFLLIFIFCSLFILNELYSVVYKEDFSMYATYQSTVPWNNRFTNFPWWNGYTNFPWFNTRLGNTTNMSYDLRGDPVVIPKTQFPWNNSSLAPIYNSPP